MMANQPSTLPSGKWRALPVSGWPPKHQEAWAEANRRDSPVRRGGRATSLSPATKVIMSELYGTFLWWVTTSGYLDPQSEPGTQMTPDLHAEFVAARRKTVSDNTTYNNLRMLAMMMKCLDPGHDWKWMWRNSGAPRRWEARAARRSPRSFPAGQLIHRIILALEQAFEVPLDQLPVERVRDCVLIALTVTSGLRVRNLASMRLDQHLICRKTGWEVLFDATEVKNEEAILLKVPAFLNPFMDRYLGVDRVRLLARCKCPTDAVWLSRKGGPLGPNGIALAFKRIGEEMLGYPINPHCVRHALATRILDNDPQDLATASLALAHSDISTVSQFYDQSGSRAAQAVWLQVLDELTEDNQTSKSGSAVAALQHIERGAATRTQRLSDRLRVTV